MITNNKKSYKLQELKDLIEQDMFKNNFSDIFDYVLYQIDFSNIKNFKQSNKSIYVYFSEDLKEMSFGPMNDFDMTTQFAPMSINFFGQKSKINDLFNKIYSDEFKTALDPIVIAKEMFTNPYTSEEDINNDLYSSIKSANDKLLLNKKKFDNEKEIFDKIIKKEILKSLKSKINALIEMDVSGNFYNMENENEKFSGFLLNNSDYYIPNKENLISLKILTNEEVLSRFSLNNIKGNNYDEMLSKYQLLNYKKNRNLNSDEIDFFINFINKKSFYSFNSDGIEKNYAYILADYFKHNKDFSSLLSQMIGNAWILIFRTFSLDEFIEAINNFIDSEYFNDSKQKNKVVKTLNKWIFDKLTNSGQTTIDRINYIDSFLDKVNTKFKIVASIRLSLLFKVASDEHVVNQLKNVLIKHNITLALTGDDSLFYDKLYYDKIKTQRHINCINNLINSDDIKVSIMQGSFPHEVNSKIHFFSNDFITKIVQNKKHNGFYTIKFFELINDFIISNYNDQNNFKSTDTVLIENLF